MRALHSAVGLLFFQSLTAGYGAPTLRYEDVKTIIDTHCVRCHNPNGDASFFPFTNFDEIKGNHEFMADALKSGKMPQDNPAFKDTPEAQKLLSWLTAGEDLFPGNPLPPPPPLPRPSELVYADVKPIIDRHCVGCHNPQGRASREPLQTLAQVADKATDMIKKIRRRSMPQGNPKFKDTPEAEKLILWLVFGKDLEQRGGGRERDDDD